MIDKLVNRYFTKVLLNELILALQIKTAYKYEFTYQFEKNCAILLCNRKNNGHYITIYKVKYEEALCNYCHNFEKQLKHILQAVRIYYEE